MNSGYLKRHFWIFVPVSLGSVLLTGCGSGPSEDDVHRYFLGQKVSYVKSKTLIYNGASGVVEITDPSQIKVIGINDDKEVGPFRVVTGYASIDGGQVNRGKFGEGTVVEDLLVECDFSISFEKIDQGWVGRPGGIEPTCN